MVPYSLTSTTSFWYLVDCVFRSLQVWGEVMFRIVQKETIGPNVNRYVIDAPLIAAKRKPGQFVVLRVGESGERIPLTIAGADADRGTITLVVQSVGKTTWDLSQMSPGDAIPDVLGPLGKPTHIEKVGTVLSVGGGIGIAPLYPITKAMQEAGNHVISVLGARSKELFIMEKEMRSVSDEVIITTDDGSYGVKGLVTDAIRTVYERGGKVDLCVAIGPPIMMKFVSLLTKELGIPTIVSLNPIMIDGTGMCGGCRVSVGGRTQFACVDGPEFDGHEVDFDGLMRRLSIYKDHECRAMEKFKLENPDVDVTL